MKVLCGGSVVSYADRYFENKKAGAEAAGFLVEENG
jgi:hypothetical protein